MSANLYVDSKGRPVTRFSYSAGGDFHFCQQFFYHRRVAGWKDKERRASLEFGKTVEAAVTFHHEHNFQSAAEHFTKLWDVHKTDTELTYTATEGSWEDLARSGRELIQLYAIRLRNLPIVYSPSPPRFQIKFSKEVFPGTELAGIEFVAYIDMIATFYDKDGTFKRLIDIKTSGVMLPQTPRILALDQQLRTYSYVTGISEVGFLNFVKTNRSLERGSEVSLLEDFGDFKAGDRAWVIKYQDFKPAEPADPAKPKSKPKPEVPEETWIVRSTLTIEEMFKTCGNGQTKVEKEARYEFIKNNAALVDKNIITKQRIQFVTAHISPERQQKTGRQIESDIAQIVHASKNNEFFEEGGVRFPNNRCSTCSCLGLCTDNDILRDQLLKRDDDEDVFGEED